MDPESVHIENRSSIEYKYTIKFNTKDRCNGSFVTVTYNNHLDNWVQVEHFRE